MFARIIGTALRGKNNLIIATNNFRFLNFIMKKKTKKLVLLFIFGG